MIGRGAKNGDCLRPPLSGIYAKQFKGPAKYVGGKQRVLHRDQPIPVRGRGHGCDYDRDDGGRDHARGDVRGYGQWPDL